jgi:hypothetical protein
VCCMGRAAQSFGLWGHQIWHLLPFSCGIRTMSNGPHLVYWASGQLQWMQTMDQCRCWNSTSRDAQTWMSWYRLLARHVIL